MSETATINNTADFAQSVIPLLKEYQEKLKQLGNEVDSIQERLRTPGPKDDGLLKLKHERLRQAFKRMHPVMKLLAQHVSQKIEHADLEESVQLELQLRLAEFEQQLFDTDQVLHQIAY